MFCTNVPFFVFQPLHNIELTAYNRNYHRDVGGIINGEVLDNLEKIKTYPIKIGSEDDLAKEVARIANLSMALGYKL